MLEPPDIHYLRAAMGWLELGNPREASGELDRISAPNREHPDVLEVWWHISAQTKQWQTCLEIADTMVRVDPTEPEPWIQRSFALHELKRTGEALDQLVHVVHRFPKVWTIPYNLACYCAQLGRLDDGEAWFKKAWNIDATAAREAAMVDRDLVPLKDRLCRLWKNAV
jgi:tetratricopeptide (TPR) repeat protein